MQEKALISVIVPVYNMEHCIQRCIDSVIAQDYPFFELILVDDGSLDACGQICDQYAAQDARIIVVHQNNKGLSAARNMGLAKVNGEWFTFIDADDWVEPTYLSYLLQCSRISEADTLIACNHWICRSRKDQPCFPVSDRLQHYTQKQACEHVLYHRAPDVSAWAKLYPAAFKDWLRYPEGRLYEDTYVFGDILLKTKGVVFGPTPQYHYSCAEQGTASISKAGYSKRSWEFCEAVKRMTDFIRAAYPELQNGCIRRNLHADISVRRLLVDCPDELLDQRKQADERILANRKSVLHDAQTPFRDRLALLLLSMGDRMFDWAWKAYQKCR